MFLKKTKQKNGRINLSFVHGYRDPVAYAVPSCQKSTGVACPEIAGYNVM